MKKRCETEEAEEGMTKVYYEAQGDRCLLSVRGHAVGSEAVCAAVSGLVYALAGYLVNCEGVLLYNKVLDSGQALLHFRGEEGAQAAFQMAVIGLAQIAKAHPAQVEVTGEKIF